MKTSKLHCKPARQRGFTLLETVIATAIVTVGLVGLLAVFAMAVSSTQTVQEDFLARQRAMEALESVYAARQTSQINWDQIQNTGNGTGIFNGGMLPLTDPGPDGLDDTSDDVPAGTLTVPGPSGVLKGTTPPDVVISLSNFQRQVQITNVNNSDGSLNPNLRQITITIQYPFGGKQKQYTVQALISSYR
jgi:prepilin-type N-terminal cleavage/methylation domain-containing protein